MHLVFVSSLVPVAEPASGFDIANRVLLDGLRAVGAKVTVIGFLEPEQSPALPKQTRLLGTLNVTNARASRITKLRWLATAMWRGTSVSCAKMHAISARDLKKQLDACEPFDALVLNSIQLAGAFPWVFAAYPSLYVAHNNEAQTARDNAQRAHNPLVRWLYERESRCLARLEQQLGAHASHIWTFSGDDNDTFGPQAQHRISTLPLITPSEVVWNPANESMPIFDLGLIGSWSWEANRLGLEWFLNDVVPHLPPGFSIAIAGNLAVPPAVDHPGVTFLGRVADAGAFVRSCRVIPLISRTGTGVQLKTIETFTAGMPAVSTTLSVRGIGTVPENCIIADDGYAFAQALIAQVEGVKSGIVAKTDGRLFRQSREDALLEQIRIGLKTLEQPIVTTRTVLDLPVLDLGWHEALCYAQDLADRPEGCSVLSFLNANNANIMMKDAGYRAALSRQIVLPDGHGVDIASYVTTGTSFPANLNGTDFVPALLTFLTQPKRIAMIGARATSLHKAAENLSRHTPWHTFLPISDGFFDRSQSQDILNEVERQKADILLVAMGSPDQEKWVDTHVRANHARLVINVGALFDFMAGEVPRAPEGLRKLRLEWVYRLAQEPSRLWRRYVLGNPLFIYHVLRHKLGLQRKAGHQ